MGPPCERAGTVREVPLTTGLPGDPRLAAVAGDRSALYPGFHSPKLRILGFPSSVTRLGYYIFLSTPSL